MTFHIKAEMEKFTWTLVDQAPVAAVEKWGNGYWIVCCPLCGYLHNISAAVKLDGTTGTTYKPNCAIAQKVHRHAYHQWLEQYPQAATCDSVKLILRPPRVIPLYEPLLPVKREIAVLPAAGKAA